MMSPLAWVLAVIAALWLVAAAVTSRGGDATRGRTLGSLAAAAVFGAAAGWLAGDGRTARNVVVIVVVIAAAAGVVALAVKWRGGDRRRRTLQQWLAAAAVLAAGWAVVCAALDVMLDAPRPLAPWGFAGLAVVPLAVLASHLVSEARTTAVVLSESIVVAGIAVFVAVVYLVVVVGIDGAPHGHERAVLKLSLVAAIAVAVLAVLVRARLLGVASDLVAGRTPSADEVATSFGARMSRSVPMDELLLQLAESLHASVAAGGAEIWTGAGGVLTRAVSMPSRPPARLQLGDEERIVVGRSRIGGPAWTAVWLPGLLDDDATTDLRVVPIAHLGELHGLVVVRRRPDDSPYTEQDEPPLVDVARQLGLALHNVRLDSALQASLAELAERNEELQASRLRIVTAADLSRRAIERNLHDGAQQHLVALAVKLGLARQIAEDGDGETVMTLLEDLRGDVQETIGELRELAHGIYPPLLRDRGLGEALRTAAVRSPLPCDIDVDLPARYPEEVETAAYFCCLEAMQNAAKYAGDAATINVRVWTDEQRLYFELTDDGAGFDAAGQAAGHGFMNMQDRLGAIGGQMEITSTPGCGTTVSASIPASPRETVTTR